MAPFYGVFHLSQRSEVKTGNGITPEVTVFCTYKQCSDMSTDSSVCTTDLMLRGVAILDFEVRVGEGPSTF